MTTPSVFLLIGLSVLLLSGLTVFSISLNISPNRQQFFTGESVLLTCEEEEGSAGWMLKRISLRQTETCGVSKGFGRLNGSSCIVSDLSPLLDRGIYWCEQDSGQRSIKVTITVSDRPFILDIPALPVMAGSDVTLRCRNRSGSTVPVKFFKFGRHSAPIRPEPDREFNISNVQQSDEGFYWCAANQTESPSSRLNVRARPSPPSNHPPFISASALVRLLCYLVVISPYCISTGMMASIYCCKKTGKAPAVTIEMAQRFERTRRLHSEHVDGVTTEHDF